MRIKTFTSPSMDTAMAQVRRELGMEAVIITAKTLDNGHVQITAATDTTDKAQDSLIEKKEIPQIFSGIQKIGKFCEKQDLSKNFQEDWISYLTPMPSKSFEEAFDRASLIKGLSKVLNFENPSWLNQINQSFVVVGPAGSGKSVFIAKLTAYLISIGRKVKLVTTDGLKSGAVNQMNTYCQGMQIDLSIALNRESLRQVYLSLDSDEVLLVDTPAINPYNMPDIYYLKELISGLNTHISLILPSGLHAKEAIETVKCFNMLGINRLLLSKLDASCYLGGFLAAGHVSQLPLALYSASPEIGNFPEVLSAEVIFQWMEQKT